MNVQERHFWVESGSWLVAQKRTRSLPQSGPRISARIEPRRGRTATSHAGCAVPVRARRVRTRQVHAVAVSSHADRVAPTDREQAGREVEGNPTPPVASFSPPDPPNSAIVPFTTGASAGGLCRHNCFDCAMQTSSAIPVLLVNPQLRKREVPHCVNHGYLQYPIYNK